MRGGTGVEITTVRPKKFQSTRPLRGGTKAKVLASYDKSISIHPPLAGRD